MLGGKVESYKAGLIWSFLFPIMSAYVIVKAGIVSYFEVKILFIRVGVGPVQVQMENKEKYSHLFGLESSSATSW